MARDCEALTAVACAFDLASRTHPAPTRLKGSISEP